MISRENMIKAHGKEFGIRSWDSSPDGALKNESAKLLIDIRKVFDEEIIPIWPFWGTLLGLYRDHDLIAWDNDTDIATLSKYFDDIVKSEEKLKALGCEDIANEGDYLITVYRNHEHCDIYFFDDKEGGSKVHRYLEVPGETFSGDEVLRWQNMNWKLVQNPEKCLEIIYGDTWGTPMKKFKHACRTR